MIGTDDNLFDLREELAKTRVAPDLLIQLKSKPLLAQPLRVIVEFNALFPGGEAAARTLLLLHLLDLTPTFDFADILRPSWIAVSPLLKGMSLAEDPPAIEKTRLELFNSLLTEKYLFGELTPPEILALASVSANVPNLDEPIALIHKIWSDQKIERQVYRSASTIKCDAARAAFNSAGQEIVWGVADTGVSRHKHFDMHGNLALSGGLRHWDFTQNHADPDAAEGAALHDSDGHGTHVAGIIAGSTMTRKVAPPNGPGSQFAVTAVQVVKSVRSDGINVIERDRSEALDQICGVAPRCKIISLKVMSTGKSGHVSRLLAAIGYVQLINGYGRQLKIHGLNLSLGYDFDPKTFAAGQSPLCIEVNRLVKSGVVVVVAAGNGGYGQVSTTSGFNSAAHGSTIADPGNAELAITVGSTHREMPHTYGISFFSAKGPTADGRMKPDLVAPGERIVSCAPPQDEADVVPRFREDTGTSMAAPHVSGAIAAFLSVRREFVGQPEMVKKLFLSGATDLGRRPEFQGAGLIDLMRTLQAV